MWCDDNKRFLSSHRSSCAAVPGNLLPDDRALRRFHGWRGPYRASIRKEEQFSTRTRIGGQHCDGQINRSTAHQQAWLATMAFSSWPAQKKYRARDGVFPARSEVWAAVAGKLGAYPEHGPIDADRLAPFLSWCERGVPSPDEGDAAALCFTEPEGSPFSLMPMASTARLNIRSLPTPEVKQVIEIGDPHTSSRA